MNRPGSSLSLRAAVSKAAAIAVLAAFATGGCGTSESTDPSDGSAASTTPVSAAPGRPVGTKALAVDVTSDGPVRSGEPVTVTGRKFPPDVPVMVTMCRIDPNDSSTIALESCSLALGGGGTVADEDGTFTTTYRPSRHFQLGTEHVDCSTTAAHCAVVAAAIGLEDIDVANSGGRAVVVKGETAPDLTVDLADGTATFTLGRVRNGAPIAVRQCAYLDELTYRRCADTNVVASTTAGGDSASLTLPFRASIGTPGAAARCGEVPPLPSPDKQPGPGDTFATANCFFDIEYDGNHFERPISTSELHEATGGVEPAPRGTMRFVATDLDASHVLVSIEFDITHDPGTVGVLAFCDDKDHTATTRCSDEVHLVADDESRMGGDLVVDRLPPSHASYPQSCERGCTMSLETQRARYIRAIEVPMVTETSAVADVDPSSGLLSLSAGHLPRRTSATVRRCDSACNGKGVELRTDEDGRLELGDSKLGGCTSATGCELEVAFDQTHQLGTPLRVSVRS